MHWSTLYLRLFLFLTINITTPISPKVHWYFHTLVFSPIVLQPMNAFIQDSTYYFSLILCRRILQTWTPMFFYIITADIIIMDACPYNVETKLFNQSILLWSPRYHVLKNDWRDSWITCFIKNLSLPCFVEL